MATDYSYSELMRLQGDAIQRVRDMQRRANQVAQDANSSLFDRQDSPPSQENISGSNQAQTNQQGRGENAQQAGFKNNAPQRNANSQQTRRVNSPAPMLRQNNSRRSPFWIQPPNRRVNVNSNTRTNNAPQNNTQPPQNPNRDIVRSTNPNTSNNIFNTLGGGNGISQLFGKNFLGGLFGDSGVGDFFKKNGFNISGIMDKLKDPESSDQILLLGLLILLSSEETDKTLLFAILYIFLG